MRRRLRKKLHCREFQQLGFDLSFEFPVGTDESARMVLVDRFYDQCEEPNRLLGGLQFSIAGTDRVTRGFVALREPNRDRAQQKRDAVFGSLLDQPEYESPTIGELVDAYYGLFRD